MDHLVEWDSGTLDLPEQRSAKIFSSLRKRCQKEPGTGLMYPLFCRPPISGARLDPKLGSTYAPVSKIPPSR
ncbi:amino acid permease [Aspergillus luchuensis]|uniref:Amino acid permease n=1 Tax=Aspergillus kawachii TaxID=1069201 RepID=A0A146G1E7_ASPKA|nr:amino acid permease [Aspergillus luchuensis]